MLCGIVQCQAVLQTTDGEDFATCKATNYYYFGQINVLKVFKKLLGNNRSS
jgi:hypothetical protein